MSSQIRVAFLLAGCGAMDGSEITEAVTLLVSLTQKGYAVDFYAPDRPLSHVVNHVDGQEQTAEKRNQWAEAARIARGKVKPLSELNSADYDALVSSGGFGVAKNFCNFAFTGKDATLESDIEKILVAFAQDKKVIAAMCIAPVLLGLLSQKLQLTDVKITFGAADNDVAKIVQGWGVTPVAKEVNQCCVDEKNRFVTTPAYMHGNASPADIFAGAQSLCDGIHSLLDAS